MRTEALQQFEVLRTVDLETARRVIGDYIQPHRLAVTNADNAAASIEMRYAKGRKIGLALAHYAKDVAIDPDAFDSFYLLQFPLTGSSSLVQTHGSAQSRPGSGWLASTGVRTQIDQRGDVLQYLIKLDSVALNAALAKLLDRSLATPVRFAPHIDIQSAGGRSLWRTVQLLASEYGTLGDDGGHPMLLAQLEETLLTAVLCGQPHNYSDMLNAAPAEAAPRALKRMIERVRADPAHEWTLFEMAQAAGVSPRTLQLACQRHLGQSPLAFLRDVRLEHVNAALKAAGPGETVTNIAMTWGFYQLGRFAQDYRRRFGESPSATIRRA